MKVVHINWGLTYGGIETMLVNIANSQVENGAEVHICIIKDLYKEEELNSDELYNQNVAVYNMIVDMKKYIADAKRMNKAKSKGKKKVG